MHRHTHKHHSFLLQDFFSCILQAVDLRRWMEEGAIGGFWWKEQGTSEWSSGNPNPRHLSLEFSWLPCELKRVICDFNDLHGMYFLTSSSGPALVSPHLVFSGSARGDCQCSPCCRWTRPGPSEACHSVATLVFHVWCTCQRNVWFKISSRCGRTRGHCVCGFPCAPCCL